MRNPDQKLRLSRLLLFFFLAALATDILFLCGIALSERPIPQSVAAPQHADPHNPAQAPALPSKPSRLEYLVNPALLLLVFLLLVIPALWIWYFHSHWIRQARPEREDLLAWLTSMSVPYLVLGFAMLLEFRAVLEDPAAGIGAIAAIMVLYALSILASFLYLEVRDLKKSFAASMAQANKWYYYSLSLSSAEDGQPSPGKSIEDLLCTWAKIYSPEHISATQPLRLSNQHSKLRRNALGTLLHTYMEEEAQNAAGKLHLERVPESVWPWKRELTDNREQDGISFLITNIGYYAKFLGQAVHFLPGAATRNSGVFLATITYALPPLWWNWQSINGDAFTYPPIEQFRNTLRSLTGAPHASPRQARVFRKIIIADGTDRWPSESYFRKVTGTR